MFLVGVLPCQKGRMDGMGPFMGCNTLSSYIFVWWNYSNCVTCVSMFKFMWFIMIYLCYLVYVFILLVYFSFTYLIRLTLELFSHICLVHWRKYVFAFVWLVHSRLRPDGTLPDEGIWPITQRNWLGLYPKFSCWHWHYQFLKAYISSVTDSFHSRRVKIHSTNPQRVPKR